MPRLQIMDTTIRDGQHSQALLSLQLPITVFVLIRLTSSRRVMGKYVNSRPLNALLVGIGAIVTILDIVLLTGM